MTAPTPRTRAQACEASENVGRNRSDNPTLGDVIAIRFGRRDFLKGALGVTAIAATVSPLAFAAGRTARADNGPRFNFKEVTAGVDANHYVADGYDANVLIRWGDPVLPGAPHSIRCDRAQPPRRGSSATTTIFSVTSRCPARPNRRATACWS